MNEDLRSQTWVRTVQDLMTVVPGLLSDRLELLALELHRAGRDMAKIFALVVATAMLATAAWLALCCGLVLALVTFGVPWPGALLAVLLFNAALAWAAVARARRLLSTLGLPATRRHLAFGVEAAASAASSSQRQPTANVLEGRA